MAINLLNISQVSAAQLEALHFSTEELEGLPTIAKFETVQEEGGRKFVRRIEYYNLDMILSVGYRVKSQAITVRHQPTQSAICTYQHFHIQQLPRSFSNN